MSESNEQEQQEQPQGQQEQPARDDAAGLKSALDREREARRTAERERKELEKRLAALEGAGKTDAEKLAALEQRLQEREQAIRERDARDAVRQAARAAGAAGDAVDAIYRMVRADVEYDEDGNVRNLDTLLKDAKAIAPQLFRVGRADGGSGNGSKPGGDTPNQVINRRIREAAGYA